MKRALFASLVLGGCTETKDPIEGTQSLAIELIAPASPGTVNQRLTDAQRTVVINIRAKGPEGELDTSFNDKVRVYAQFLGTITPDLEDTPLAEIQMTGGIAMGQTITLPNAYADTTLWIDNGTGLGPDYQFGAVTGTSPTLWYRDPFVADLQRPASEMALDALSRTPLTDKQVRVSASRHGDRGALVVTSTFSQGYTLSDVQCATGGAMPTPPCTAGDYDHMLVFTFSSPRDQFGRPLQEGEVLGSFNGGLTEFNGLTEIGFPRTFLPQTEPSMEPVVNRGLLPAPKLFDLAWFGPLDAAGTGRINFERNEAGPIEIRNAKVCPLDEGPDGAYTRFKQWSIDPSAAGDQCGTRNVIALITAGTDFTTDPRELVGRTLPKVVGIVRPVSIGTFNVWIVHPRGKDDLQTQ